MIPLSINLPVCLYHASLRVRMDTDRMVRRQNTANVQMMPSQLPIHSTRQSPANKGVSVPRHPRTKTARSKRTIYSYNIWYPHLFSELGEVVERLGLAHVVRRRHDELRPSDPIVHL